MRPDKKGKRKPHQGQAASNVSKGASKTNSPKCPAPKDNAPAKETSPRPTPAQSAPPGPVGPPPRPPGDIGPRVLEPANPVEPAGQQDKYRRREIRSNWAKYELPAEPEPEPGEDYRVGDTFDELLASAGTGVGYFSLRSERSWLEDSGSTPELLTLDVPHLTAVLHRLPLHQRLDIDLKHFTEEELAVQRSEAEQHRSAPLAEPGTALERARTQREQTDAISQHMLGLLREEAPAADAVLEDVAAGGDAPPAPLQTLNRANGLQPAAVPSSTDGHPAGDTSIFAAVPPPPSSTVPAAAPSVPLASATPAASNVPAASAASESPATGSESPAASTAKSSATSAISPPAKPSVVSSAPLLDEDWLDSVLSDED